jgi:hypothetical protein
MRHDAGDPDEAFRVPFTVLDSGLMIIWTLLAQIVAFSIAAVAGRPGPRNGPVRAARPRPQRHDHRAVVDAGRA